MYDRFGRRAAETRVTEAVVHVPLVGVGEHRIGFGALLEALLGALVSGIAVGVVLERELAVRAFDLDFGCRALDAEDFVVVAFAHELLATFTVAGRRSFS